VRDVLNALLAGAPLDGLPTGRHLGRADLRASWLVSTRGVNDPALARPGVTVPTLRGVTLTGIDFTGSTAQFHLDGCVMTDCVLDRAGWQGWQVRDSLLEDCSFTRADLRDSRFDAESKFPARDAESGKLPGPDAAHRTRAGRSIYRRCDFTRARTGPYAGWGHALFEDCLFDSTAFSYYAGGQRFRGASFSGCTFRGTYKNLEFGYPKDPDGLSAALRPVLRDTDFRAATVGYLTFHLVPENCQLPASAPP
jgi:uncharacterized protein YjbI with pentapeptide repeats